jgi:hypothetical protein
MDDWIGVYSQHKYSVTYEGIESSETYETSLHLLIVLEVLDVLEVPCF